MMFLYVPAGLLFTGAALLRRPTAWTCRACGHRNGTSGTHAAGRVREVAEDTPAERTRGGEASVPSALPRRRVPRPRQPVWVPVALSTAIPAAWAITGFATGWPPIAFAMLGVVVPLAIGIAWVLGFPPGLRKDGDDFARERRYREKVARRASRGS